MKLYFSPGACSLAPHIALIESGLSFAIEQVDLKNKTYKGGDYWKINPKGSVPALEFDDGTVLTEASVILQYIADQKPEKQLLPRNGSMERYRAIEWLNYISTEIHKGFSPLWNQAMPEEAKNIAKDVLSKKFDFLDPKLSEHLFITGNGYSVADAYLFTVLNWTRKFKIDLTKWNGIMGFMERVKNRPATMQALKEEGLIS